MTPYDCVCLYKTLRNHFGESQDNISVSSVFVEDNKRLSLDDARKYEKILKERLIS